VEEAYRLRGNLGKEKLVKTRERENIIAKKKKKKNKSGGEKKKVYASPGATTAKKRKGGSVKLPSRYGGEVSETGRERVLKGERGKDCAEERDQGNLDQDQNPKVSAMSKKGGGNGEYELKTRGHGGPAHLIAS